MARDVYGEHPDDLDSKRRDRLFSFLALRILENEEIKESWPKQRTF